MSTEQEVLCGSEEEANGSLVMKSVKIRVSMETEPSGCFHIQMFPDLMMGPLIHKLL